MNKAQQIVYEEVRALNGIPIDEEMYKKVIALLYDRVHADFHGRGKIITSGIGKAGQVAHNLALTFSSTGTPAVFLHPGEAQHGDLGVIQPKDILLLVSNSGETRELVDLVILTRKLFNSTEMPIITITSKETSTLAKMSNFVLLTGDPTEVCPLGLTPTTSTTVMSVIGDILVVMLMERIGFTAEEYYKRHHGGYLGEKAKSMKEEKDGNKS